MIHTTNSNPMYYIIAHGGFCVTEYVKGKYRTGVSKKDAMRFYNRQSAEAAKRYIGKEWIVEEVNAAK